MPPNDGSSRRSRLVVGLVTATVVLAGAVAVAVWARGAQAPVAPRARQIPLGTVEIKRTDLSTSRTLRGALGYGTPRVLKSAREGVVTWLPRPGQVLMRGSPVYAVNDEPVPLFLGTTPLYRTLHEPGTAGRDVATVLKNLTALGYATGEKAPATRSGDVVLTDGLIAAVKRWQRDRRMADDGVLEAGDVVVMSAPVRVDTVTAGVGDSAAGDLLSVTPTTRTVTAQVGVAEAASLVKGDPVTLRMPDGATAPGRIGAIANVATAAAEEQPGSPQEVAVTIETKVSPRGLDGGGVDISVPGRTRKRVLAAPVTALLALREGGYALQLPDERLLPVRTGLFAMGMVEVSGPGITEGLTVVTTS